jgi:hypothetical protein
VIDTDPLTIETDRERHLLYALALMSDQYLGDEHEGRTVLDHLCMGPGEEAYKALLAYGLIDVEGRGARWTIAGEQLLDLPLNREPFPR